MKEEKNFGFTLAEVLITLGIIGVVAAITIPALINNIQDSQFRSAFKKAYSDINNAFTRAYTDNGPDVTAGCPVWILNNIQPYMAVQKFCSNGNTSAGNCWHSDLNWSNIIGDKLSMSDVSFAGQQDLYGKSVILNNGTMIMMWEPTCSTNLNYGGYSPAKMLVDVNGFKGPNVVGKDIQNISIVSPNPTNASTIYSIIPGYNYSSPTIGNCKNFNYNRGNLGYGLNCAKLITSGIDF